MKARDHFYNRLGLCILQTNSEFKGRVIPFLTFFLVSFAIYFVSLDFFFLVDTDDRAYIFQNPYLQQMSLANTAAIFSNLHYGDYLPVNLLSYSWDFTWSRFNPFGYRLTQVFLHSLNACLLFAVLRLLKVSERACWVSVLVFAVHPVQVESVVWISERKNLLSSFFILLSLWLYLRHAISSRFRRDFYYLCLLSFSLALLSKSISVMLPCVFVLLDLLILKRKRVVMEKVPFFLLSLLSGLATIASQGALGAIREYTGGSISVSLLYTLRVYWDYVVSLVFPFQLSPRYFFNDVSLTDPQSLLAYLFFFGVCWFVVRSFRSSPVAVFAIGWFLLWLLPVSNLIPISVLRQDRYLYLPSIAVIVMVSLWLESLWQGQQKKLANALIVGVLFFLGSLSFMHTFVYASERSYWQRVANHHPQNAYTQLEAGYYCEMADDIVCAEKRYRQTLAINPKHSSALNNLGALMINRGRYEEAKAFLDKALLTNPSDAIVYSNRILLAEKSGVGRENIPVWKKKVDLFKQMKKDKDLLLGKFRFR